MSPNILLLYWQAHQLQHLQRQRQCEWEIWRSKRRKRKRKVMIIFFVWRCKETVAALNTTIYICLFCFVVCLLAKWLCNVSTLCLRCAAFVPSDRPSWRYTSVFGRSSRICKKNTNFASWYSKSPNVYRRQTQWLFRRLPVTPGFFFNLFIPILIQPVGECTEYIISKLVSMKKKWLNKNQAK